MTQTNQIVMAVPEIRGGNIIRTSRAYGLLAEYQVLGVIGNLATGQMKITAVKSASNMGTVSGVFDANFAEVQGGRVIFMSENVKEALKSLQNRLQDRRRYATPRPQTSPAFPFAQA